MKKPLLAALALLGAALSAEAQVKSRWHLDWQNEKPQVFTFRSPDDKFQNVWFFTFTIENKTDEIVPLILDVMLYTETGKELMHDQRKVDSAVIKEERDSPKKAESLKYGRFHPNVIDPETEFKVIEYHAKLGARSDGMVRESIEAFKKGFVEDPPADLKGRWNWKKGDRIYLNPREIRQQRVIHPGQKIMGVAIFKNVDPRANMYEVHVWGLVDIIRITEIKDDEWKMEYEPQTLKIKYERHGDPFHVERDVLYRLVKKEYVTRKIGPIGSKDTVDKLVLALADTLKKEQEWKDKGLQAAEIEAARKKDSIDPLDCRVMAMVFRQAVEKDFGYDPSKDVVENEKAVWKIHEWWITNRSKLVFDEIQNRFIVKDDLPPGTVIDKN